MNTWTKRFALIGEKMEAFLAKLEDKYMTEDNLLWFDAFIKSSAVSLLSISFIWIGIELLVTGQRTESGIDTIIAFVASFAIGFYYAQNRVKKEKIRKMEQIMGEQNRILNEQMDTLKKVWAIKKPRQ